MHQFSMILHNPNAQKFFYHFLPPRPLKIFILFIIKANYHNSTTITSINFKFGSWYHWMMGPEGYKIEVYLKRCSRCYKKCPKKPKEQPPIVILGLSHLNKHLNGKFSNCFDIKCYEIYQIKLYYISFFTDLIALTLEKMFWKKYLQLITPIYIWLMPN